jgi:hypothetical protein
VNSYRYRHTTLVGNFLGRVGTERVQALFGAGFGLNFKATESTIANVGCIPTPQISCSVLNFDSDDSETGLVQQLVAGVDVRLTDRLTAYATIRARTLPEPDQQVALLAGLRATVRRAPVAVPFSTRNVGPPPVATGRQVHVVAPDHSRQTGRLVSLDNTQVTISRPDGQVSIPLKEVQGIRLVSHAFRNATLIGLGVGFGAGVLWGTSIGEADESYELVGGLIVGGIGAGVGAAVGTIANLRGAAGRTVYIGPGKAALKVSPVIGKGRAGFAGLVSW